MAGIALAQVIHYDLVFPFIIVCRSSIKGAWPGHSHLQLSIAHFTVVCLVTWPWVGSEAGG